LTRPFDKHLDSDELEKLVSPQGTSASGSEQLSEQALGEAQRHVESCQDCSRKVQMHKSVQGKILGMRATNPTQPTPECIGDAEWLEVAAGLYPDAKTRELMKHAAQCGYCGPLLESAGEMLADETTPSEQKLLASLPSARPGWPKSMAETLRSRAGAKENNRKHKEGAQWWQAFFSWPRPALALAGISVAVVAGWLGSWMIHSPSAEQLLAQAYTDHRTLEVRIPGAKYAPMRVERSAGVSNLDKSPSLLKAEALISENLSKNPNDPAWLQAKARADLLDGNYESAIKSLERALETQPNSPSLLTDLGSAYFLRAEAADRPIDYGNAIEFLGRALAKSPDDPIALFNRALAGERMFLYTRAVDDWEHYLRVDTTGEWSEEARKRLMALKMKLEQHEKSSAEPLLTPFEITIAAAGDAIALPRIEERIEEYLHVAVAEWLPMAYSAATPVEPSATAARNALNVLAHDLASRHGDRWLEDVLLSKNSSAFTSAIAALNRAVEHDARGDPTDAERDAQQAKKEFAQAGSEPGYLRAAVEQIYALHRSAKSKECLVQAREVGREVGGRLYPWIRAQLNMEQASCLSMVGDMGEAQRFAIAANNAAEGAGYDTLHLRALGYLAGLAADTGNMLRAWAQNTLGLRKYWGGTYPSQRAYQFYDELDALAEEQNQWHLALAFAQEAVHSIAATNNRSVEAMARYQQARMAKMANSLEESRREFMEAGKIFNDLPASDATQVYALDATVSLAAVELQSGQLQQAEGRLSQVRQKVRTIDNYPIALRFYQTMGELAHMQGRDEEAEQDFRAAIAIGEWGLKSLNDERDRLTWNRETSDAYRSTVEFELHTLGRTEEALELWEWYKSAALRPGEHNLRNNDPGIDFSTLTQQGLPFLNAVSMALPSLRKETVISYAEFTDGLAIFIYDDRGIRGKWVPVPSAQLIANADLFRDMCADPHSDLDTLRHAGRQLYDWLIAPIVPDLSVGRVLVIEPDRGLQNVPFRALVKSDGQYLGGLYSVLLSPGLTYELQLNPSVVFSPNDRLLVVGAPAQSEERSVPDLKPLPEALYEAELVGSRFNTPTVLSGRAATLDVVEQELPVANIFHFAGHAVVSAGGVGLLLAAKSGNGDSPASEQLLDADWLYGKKFRRGQLVVLSACATTTSGTSGLVSPDSLVRGFLRAGVPHVVATD
jgi:tetratricopeptide (TPR) repeat protein